MNKQWSAKDDTIIFDSHFDEELDIELISDFTKIIFNDYYSNNYEFFTDDHFDYYINYCDRNEIYGVFPYVNHKFTIISNSRFNRDISNLPHNLTFLTLGYSFDRDVSNLPLSLTRLTFGCSFNCDVSKLPHSLTVIIFGDCFNQNVSNLPPFLIHLIFGAYFNQDVSNLPPNLIHITFGFYFNQDISKLPHTLTHLNIGCMFRQQSSIPPNVKYLKLDCDNPYIIDSLPNHVIELEINRNFSLEMNNLPTSIKKIVINKKSHYNTDLNCLPDFVEELHLNSYYRKRILNIPSNLKKLKCDKYYPYKDDFAMIDIENICEYTIVRDFTKQSETQLQEQSHPQKKKPIYDFCKKIYNEISKITHHITKK